MNLMAEDEGFEPPQTESESGVLPLHKSSMWNRVIIPNFLKMSSFISEFFQKRCGAENGLLFQGFKEVDHRCDQGDQGYAHYRDPGI